MIGSLHALLSTPSLIEILRHFTVLIALAELPNLARISYLRPMKFKFCFLFLGLSYVGCKQEQEMPREVIFASKHDAFVYNLKRIDPMIATKLLEIPKPIHGEHRLVLNNNYLIYEPGPHFDSETLSIKIDGMEKLSLVLVEASSGCVPLARSYEFEVSTSSSVLNQELYNYFCQDDLISRVTSFIAVTPIDGVEFMANYSNPPLSFSCDFTFTPQPGVIGEAEYIYEVGADDAGFTDEVYKARQAIAGLIKLKVIG